MSDRTAQADQLNPLGLSQRGVRVCPGLRGRSCHFGKRGVAGYGRSSRGADSDAYPVSFMCAQLGVSRSGYYAWRGAGPSRRDKDDRALIAVKRKVHELGRGNPGVRRMRAGLAALAISTRSAFLVR
jgi:hypothetical protein